MVMGRPTKYTPEMGDLICEGISLKKSMETICTQDDMPAPKTVYCWLRKYSDFRHNYILAKEDQSHALVEEGLSIADNLEIDPQHKRIMVDQRKWMASRYNRKNYGDKVESEISGPGGGPIESSVNVVFKPVNNED